MKRFLFMTFLLSISSAWAGPEEDTLVAYLRNDYETGLRIAIPLASKGEAWAQQILGNSYAAGLGLPKNYTEAMKWFRLAADQGNADAQFSLGAGYHTGQGALQDYVEAIRWYRLVGADSILTHPADLRLTQGW